MPFGGAVSRTEVLAALSLAVDLGLGQPMDHMLRSAAMGTRLAERLGLSEGERGTVFYTGLVMWIGCHADSHEYTRWFGDMTATSSIGPVQPTGDFSLATWAVGRRCRNEPSWRPDCSWTHAGI